jgi:primosomal protein N' (replication factor Y)
MMPDIKLVDPKNKKKGNFSDTLIEETSAIALGEQVILFQNRRGYSLVECMTCGHVPLHCNVM